MAYWPQLVCHLSGPRNQIPSLSEPQPTAHPSNHPPNVVRFNRFNFFHVLATRSLQLPSLGPLLILQTILQIMSFVRLFPCTRHQITPISKHQSTWHRSNYSPDNIVRLDGFHILAIGPFNAQPQSTHHPSNRLPYIVVCPPSCRARSNGACSSKH